MKENGKAATIDIVCNGLRPPFINKPIARLDCTIPQTIFLPWGGLRSPFEESIAKTNVPESADVTKKIINRNNATTERTIPMG